MNCPTCGVWVVAPEGNCTNCGAPLGRAASSGQQQEPVTQQLPAQQLGHPAQQHGHPGAQQAQTPPPWNPVEMGSAYREPEGRRDQPAREPEQADGRPGFLEDSPLRLSTGEVVWRKYRAVALHGRGGGEGTLYVTDARVVFFARARGRGAQRGSSLVQQTRLEDITGLAAYASHRLSLGPAIAAGFFSLIALLALSDHSWFWFFFWAALAAIFLTAVFGGSRKRGSAGVVIHSRATMASPIGFGSFDAERAALTGFMRVLLLPFTLLFRTYTAFDVALGGPGEDSELLIAELGALILDLQARGPGSRSPGSWPARRHRDRAHARHGLTERGSSLVEGSAQAWRIDPG